MFRRICDKYKSLAEPVKASLWFLICGFLHKGIAFLTTPIYTRLMTEEEFGRANIYISWFNIITIIATLQLAAGVYMRGLVKHEEDADAFSSALLSLSTVCTLVFTAVYFVFHGVINEFTGLSVYLMVLMVVEMLCTVAYQFWSNRERVEFRYKKLVVLMVVYTVLRPIAGVIGVLLADEGHQVEGRVTATTLVCLLLFGGLFVSILKKGKRLFHRGYWKYALLFNIPLIPHYLSQILLSQSDRIMIEKFCTEADVAYYSVAYALATVMLIFNSAVSSTMTPWLYRMIKEQNYKRLKEISYIVLIAIAGINLVMVAMGPELLKIVAPENYGAAVWVIPPVTASVYFMFLYDLFAAFEYYYSHTKLVSVATVLGAGLNILLNAIFIPMYGFVAAGYTTLACYIIYAIAHYVFMRRVAVLHMDGYRVYNAGIIAFIGLVFVALSGLMLAVYEVPLVRYLLLALLVGVVVLFRKKLIATFKEMKAK